MMLPDEVHWATKTERIIKPWSGKWWQRRVTGAFAFLLILTWGLILMFLVFGCYGEW